jgi:hypothetical protein
MASSHRLIYERVMGVRRGVEDTNASTLATPNAAG